MKEKDEKKMKKIKDKGDGSGSACLAPNILERQEATSTTGYNWPAVIGS